MMNFLIGLFDGLNFWHAQPRSLYSLGAIMVMSYVITSALVGFWGTIVQDGLSLKNSMRGATYVLLNALVSVVFYAVALSVWRGAFYAAGGATVVYEIAVAVVVIKNIATHQRAGTEKMMKWEAAYVKHTNNFKRW